MDLRGAQCGRVDNLTRMRVVFCIIVLLVWMPERASNEVRV